MSSLFTLLILAITITLTLQNYPDIEKDVLFWLNKVRADPTIIIPHLQKQLHKFKGKIIPLTPAFKYATNEGPAAWIEAINYLKSQKPMGTLHRHAGLDKAAYDHAMDLKNFNTIRHEGIDGSRPKNRIEKHCIFEVGQISQNIAQQFIDENRLHGLETIVSLIIDDGVKNRGHRFSLFTSKYQYVGVNVQKALNHYVVVIELSSHNLKLRNIGPLAVIQPIYLNSSINRREIQISQNMIKRDTHPINLHVIPFVQKHNNYIRPTSYAAVTETGLEKWRGNRDYSWRHIW